MPNTQCPTVTGGAIAGPTSVLPALGEEYQGYCTVHACNARRSIWNGRCKRIHPVSRFNLPKAYGSAICGFTIRPAMGIRHCTQTARAASYPPMDNALGTSPGACSHWCARAGVAWCPRREKSFSSFEAPGLW